VYAFRIYFFQEEDTIGTEQAEIILSHVVDAALDALDTDFILGGSILFSEPFTSEWGQFETAQGGNLLYASMTLRVHEDFHLTP
jgi:hypothetical protein